MSRDWEHDGTVRYFVGSFELIWGLPRERVQGLDSAQRLLLMERLRWACEGNNTSAMAFALWNHNAVNLNVVK